MQTEAMHQPVNHKCGTGHITGSLKKGESDKEQDNIGKKDQHTANTGDNAVNDNGAEHFIRQERSNHGSNEAEEELKASHDRRTECKGQLKYCPYHQ